MFKADVVTNVTRPGRF